MRHSIHDRERVVLLLEQGYPIREVSRQTGVPKSSIGDLWKKYRETGEVADRKIPGRPKKLNQVQLNFMRQLFSKHRTETARKIQRRFHQQTNISLSTAFIRLWRRLSGYHAIMPRTRFPLTQAHIAARLAYAKKHRRSRWTTSVFVDEKIFQLGPNLRYVHVRSADPTRFRWVIRKPHPKKVNAIAAISKKGRCGIALFTGTLNSTRMKTFWKRNILPKIRQQHQNQFTIVWDNDRKHHSKFTQEWLREESVRQQFLPAHSPDLNPIEKVWSRMGDEVNNKRPRTIDGLKKAIKSVWEELP